MGESSKVRKGEKKRVLKDKREKGEQEKERDGRKGGKGNKRGVDNVIIWK